MKKTGKLLSLLLAAVMLTATLAAVTLSVGAVEETASDNAWLNVTFSEILTSDMTSDQIAAKLLEKGIKKEANSGDVTYSFANGKLKIAASTKAVYLKLAQDNSLKTAYSETILGKVAVVSPMTGISPGKTSWAYMIYSGKDNANCYKGQFRTTSDLETSVYTFDPAIKADNQQLTADGKNRLARVISNAYTEKVTVPVDVTVRMDYDTGMYTYMGEVLVQDVVNSDAAKEAWKTNRDKVLSSNTIRLDVSAGAAIELESICVRRWRFTSKLTDLYGRKSKVTLGMGEKQTLPAISGAEWKNAKGETVTEIAANTEDTYTQVTDKTVVFCGAQATKTMTDGTYSVRLIAVVDSIDFDAVGFAATVSYGEGEPQTVTGTCRYAYTSILGDGETYAATDFGGKYFVVLHVDGVPASVATAEWTVRVYTVSGGAESDGIGGSVTVDAPAQAEEG